jgi:putative ABC transport system permease protein
MRRGGPAPGEGGPQGMARGGGLFGAPGQATIELSALKDEIVRPVRSALIVLFASVGFVLLIACTNIANLLLARAVARRQEIAVRSALGATRARIVRQVLAESVSIAAIGGLAGMLLAWAGVQAIRVLGPADVPRLADVSVDLRVFAFTLAISAITGALCGLMPALRLSRVDEMQAIKAGAAGAASGLRLWGQHRTRSVLAVVEVALAMMLLVGAGLLINSFRALSQVNPGYDPHHVLAFQVALPDSRYPVDRRTSFYDQLVGRLSAMPGVVAAAVSNTLPLQQGVVRLGLHVQGQPEPTRPEDMTVADIRVIGPDYLRAMGIAVTDGRGLTRETVQAGAREVLVNESFARRYLTGGRTVGARLQLDGPAPWDVVGIVNDVRHAGLDAEPFPEIYVDYHQATAVMPLGLRNAFFTIRTRQDPASLAAEVRGAVRQIDPDLVVDNVATMEDRLWTSIARPRFYATLAGAFAAIALILAAVGVYGVLAYAVSQCTREIGIRMTLGATRPGVLGLVLGQGGLIAAIGVAGGLAGAFVVTRSLSSLLFGLTPFDPATFALATALLAAAVVLACAVPAWRATRVDPIVALRQE